MRLLWQCAAMLWALCATAAVAHPFTIDDLLRLEDVGQVQFAPGGRWLVIQSFAGHDTAGLYDYDHQYRRALSRLSIVDLTSSGPAEPLLPAQDGVGYTPGPISPKGRKMLVHRLVDHRWEAGVVDLASRHVRWLGLSIDLPLWGRSTAWRSDDELLAITTPADSPPLYLRVGSQARSTLPDRWERSASGVESATMVGSGHYLSRGGAAPQNGLVRIDVTNGHVTKLSTGEYFDLELSPDGRFLAATRWGADIQPKAREVLRGASATRRRELEVVDLARDEVSRPCQACDILSHLLSWSPRGDQLLVYARQPGQAWAQGRFTVIEARTGLTTAIQGLHAEITYSFEGVDIAKAGWMGDAPAAWTRAGDRLAWRRANDAAIQAPAALPADASKILIGADGRLALSKGKLWRSDPDGRHSVLLGSFDVLPQSDFGDGARVSAAAIRSGRHWLVKQDGGLARISTNGRVVDLGATGADDTILGEEGEALVLARTDAHGVQRLVLRKVGAERPLMTLNGFLNGVDFGPLQPIHHKGPDGQDLVSWLVLPPGGRPGQRPPVVVLPYPGEVHGAAAPYAAKPGAASYTTNAQLIAAQGYAALIPSLPRNAVSHDPADGLARDILAIVDAAGAEGLIDPARVGLWGQSFGGFAALAAASQSPRFFAVVDTAGPTDLSFSQGRILPQGRLHPEDGLTLLAAIGWAETGQAGLGGPPWAVPERYWRNSPRLQADKITAPVLLAYGDLDPVGLDEGEAMFSALYRQGKDARLLTLWGEGHVILSPGNMRRLYREGLAWLDDGLARRGDGSQGVAP